MDRPAADAMRTMAFTSTYPECTTGGIWQGSSLSKAPRIRDHPAHRQGQGRLPYRPALLMFTDRGGGLFITYITQTSLACGAQVARCAQVAHQTCTPAVCNHTA